MQKRKRNMRLIKVLLYSSFIVFYACVQKKHFEEMNAKMPDQIPVVSDIAAVFFQDCNYNGYSLALTEGEYNLSDLMAHGVKNNDLSSLKLANGYQVIFFDQVNFGGASIIEMKDVSCLVEENWNDRVSSLKIVRIEEND